jgi:hypothetical protein
MAALTIEDVMGALTDNKVFLQLKPNSAFEQGSLSAKTLVTLPAKCMPMSILSRPKPAVVKAPVPAVVKTATAPVAKVPKPVSEPIVVKAEPVAKEPEPVVQDALAEPPVAKGMSLKELKKEKVAAIRDIATRLGIALAENGKTKIKDALIADILAIK